MSVNPASGGNPGVSLNFDAQALHDAEEAEYQREEQQRQQELCNLLTAAFDDDLSDDDEEDEEEEEDYHNGPREEPIQPHNHNPNRPGWDRPGPASAIPKHMYALAQTSTPVRPEVPPLATPAQTPYTTHNQVAGPTTDQTPYPEQQYHYPTHDTDVLNHDIPGNPVDEWKDHMRRPQETGFVPRPLFTGRGYGEREETEGGNDPDHQQYYGATKLQHHDAAQLQHHDAAQLQHHDAAQLQHHDAAQLQHHDAAQLQHHDAAQLQHHDVAQLQHHDAAQLQHHDAAQLQHHDDYYMTQAYPEQGHGHPVNQPPPSHLPQRDIGLYDATHQNNYQQDDAGYYGSTDYASLQPGPALHPALPSMGSQENILALAIQDRQPIRAEMNPTSGMPDHHRPQPQGELLEGYRVKYQGSAGGQGHGQPDSTDRPTTAPEPIQPSNVGQQLGHNFEDMQRDFLTQGGNTDSRQLSQLQILYSARGRKIEELSSELKTLREDSDREIRILKHKVALTQDERDGLEGSLKQSHSLVHDARQKEAELEGKVVAMETQITALQQGKEELVKKLQSAESTIESLNIHLCELEKSDTLARTRGHHDTIVSGLQHKYEAQILDLKEKLDASQKDGEIKADEVSSLKKRVTELLKSSENAQIDRADTINRLSQSLEESQRQCQLMLEAGTGQELSKVKLQLQDTIAGKTIAEDMLSVLQEELQDLKEQVMMYESASQYGVVPIGGSTATTPRGTGGTSTQSSADDSYVQLGIKKSSGDDSSTPRLSRCEGDNLSTDQTLHGLKHELERCLAMYRTKRQQVSSLQEELRASRSALDNTQAKVGEVEKKKEETAAKLVQYEAEFGPLDGSGVTESVQERRLQRQVDSLTRDRQSLNDEVKELSKRIGEIAASEERVKDINQELRHQMVQMVKEFDEDKRQALEHCQNTVLEHHDKVKARMETELQEQFIQEKHTLTKKYEDDILILREELEGSQKDLDEVKAMYVSVCQEKEQLETKTAAIWQDKMESSLKDVKEIFSKDKEEEIMKLKLTWAANNDTALAAAKEKWTKEQEEEVQQKVDIQVAAAKVSWLREHAAAKELSVKLALANAEREWAQRWAQELDSQVQARLQEAKDKYNFEKAKENVIRSDAVTNTSVLADSGLSSTERATVEAEITHRVNEARQLWQDTDLVKAIAEERAMAETILKERLEAARKDWRETELKEALEVAAAQAVTSKHENENLKTKVEDMLVTAKAAWFEEQRREAEAMAARVREATRQEAQTRVQEATIQLQQELAELRSSKQKIEGELSIIRAEVLEEKAELIAAKDAERRHAVETTQDQCEKDYREFLSEHQNTLNKALRTAREEFAQEKSEIERKHERELQGLRDREAKSAELEVAVNKERAKLEHQWQEKLDHMAQKHAEEKDVLMKKHRENLLRALEEARARWQQKYEEALAENSSSGLEEKEAAWSAERNALKAELLHYTTRIKSSTEQHQLALNKIKMDLEQAHKTELNMLRDELTKSHDTEMAASTAEMHSQLDKRSVEMEHLSEEVRICVSGLEEAQCVASQEAQELRSVISQRDSEIARLKAELTASAERFNASEHHNKKKLEGKHKEVEEAEQQAQEVIEAFRAKEGEHAQVTASYKDRQRELVERLRKAERRLEAANTNTQKQVALVQESLEREHTIVMEKMKAKLVELRSSNIVALDNLRKQHTAEKRELKKQIEEMKQHLQVPPQANGDRVGAEVFSELEAYYLKTVNKMKAEILQHVRESNIRAAETVRTQVIQDRHNTAQRLRRYYMKCLNRLLDAESQHLTRKEKLTFFEEALDAVPSRDISQLTLQSTSSGDGDGGGSRSNTPDFTTIMTTTSSTSKTTTPHLRDLSVTQSVDAHSHLPQSANKPPSKPHDSIQRYKQKGQYSQESSSNNQDSFSLSPKENQRLVDTCLDLKYGQSHSSQTSANSKMSSATNTPASVQRKSCLRNNSYDSQSSSSESRYQSGYSQTPAGRQPLDLSRKDTGHSKSESRTNSSARSKYNLSSIERPRGSKSTRFSDDIGEFDVDLPSVGKSQSASYLDQSSHYHYPSGRSEPRRFYDVDMHVLRTSTSTTGQESNNSRETSTPLTKVDSETYLLTPVGFPSELHGSVSMGDVRDLDDDLDLSGSKPMCQSDDGLLNVDSEGPRVRRGFKSPKKSKLTSSAGPLKCMSMPDVANSDDLAWLVNGHATVRSTRSKNSTMCLLTKYGDDDSSGSYNADPAAYVSTRCKQSRTCQSDTLTPFKNDVGFGSRSEHHRVAFRTADHCLDDSTSDNESVRSFASTSSVGSFRQALKTKHTRSTVRTQAGGGDGDVTTGSTKKPLKAPPPSSELQNMLSHVPDNVHRPVAMVTRHTQMPSPRPVYKSRSCPRQ